MIMTIENSVPHCTIYLCNWLLPSFVLLAVSLLWLYVELYHEPLSNLMLNPKHFKHNGMSFHMLGKGRCQAWQGSCSAPALHQDYHSMTGGT
jgi:hypothetical protein